MEYTPNLEEYSRIYQMLQPRSEQLNSNTGASATQPLASAVEERPILSADWSHFDPSMGHTSTVGQSPAHSEDSSHCYPSMTHASTVGQPPRLSADWSRYDRSMSRAFMIRQPPTSSVDSSHCYPYMGHASTVGQPPVHSVDWSHYDPSMSRASMVGQPCAPSAGYSIHHPSMSHASTVGKPPVLSVEWSRSNPSMGHAFASLDPNRAMHTVLRPPTVDNLYQSNMQSSSVRQYRATEFETEDHLGPGKTTTRIRSSELSLSPQETSPSKNNVESTHGEPQEQDELGGPLKCFWEGCKHDATFSSPASLMRHVRVQHVAHRAVKCPECGQAFGRVDNMKEHRGKRHRKYDQD